MSNQLDNHSSNVEIIADGITREWLDEGQIIQYNIDTVSRLDLQQWSDAVIISLETWDPSTPYLALYNFLDTRAVVSPFLQEMSGKLTAVGPEAKGRVAIVLPEGPAGQLLQMMTTRMRAASGVVRQFRTFSTVDQALAWLREKQP